MVRAQFKIFETIGTARSIYLVLQNVRAKIVFMGRNVGVFVQQHSRKPRFGRIYEHFMGQPPLPTDFIFSIAGCLLSLFVQKVRSRASRRRSGDSQG